MEATGTDLTIEEACTLVEQTFPEDARIGKIFQNCIRDTIDRTIKRLPDVSIFVITGDIPAMWLRVSSCQLRPYILFARSEAKTRPAPWGLVRKMR